ncbi:unnamed protein product [Albugo candida]|uniref:Uncharacterized protein n=1 Tax=Albugo candida TaxID=65357 RepID=A0A024GFG3_9STRA|nr:unnamed protein product [Albugo candida]|eukprot:CCI45082.1 unnamed protein product [Albugo candida]
MPRRLTHDEKTREERMLSEWRRTRAVYTDDRVPQIDTEEHGFCIKKQLTDAITLIQYNKNPQLYNTHTRDHPGDPFSAHWSSKDTFPVPRLWRVDATPSPQLETSHFNRPMSNDIYRPLARRPILRNKSQNRMFDPLGGKIRPSVTSLRPICRTGMPISKLRALLAAPETTQPNRVPSTPLSMPNDVEASPKARPR